MSHGQPAAPEELAAVGALIDHWAQREREENATVAAVEYEAADRRWHVRMRGEDKTAITVWLTLRQRTLHYETHFMPAPEENIEALYEFLLRINTRLHQTRFAIGLEDALYLVGETPIERVDDDELDRIVGSAYAYCEQYFRQAMSIGYASRFRPQTP